MPPVIAWTHTHMHTKCSSAKFPIEAERGIGWPVEAGTGSVI